MSDGSDNQNKWSNGQAGYTVTAGENVTIKDCGRETARYNTTGITSYGTGLFYNNQLYSADGNMVTLTLEHNKLARYTFKEYTADAGTFTGSQNSYTLTMPSGNVTIDAVYEKNPPLENRSEISADEIVLGDSVTVKAAACNGDNGYLYTILYREDSNQNWIESQSYSINDTLPLTPSKAGNYEICVKVRDSAGDAAEKFFTVKVHEKLTGISSLSSGVISVGQQITVNCLAKGGMGEYQYRVSYKENSQTEWTVLQEFDKNSSVTLEPQNASAYDILVQMRDGTGNTAEELFALSVNEPLDNYSTLSAEDMILGEQVIVNCLGVGGIGERKYQVSYKLCSETDWYVIKNVKDGSSVTLEPDNTGDYDISVEVQDIRGNASEKFFTLHVYTSLENHSVLSAENIILGQEITAYCLADGGKAPYQYQVVYKQTSQTKWTTVQNFNENSSVTFKPAKATAYDVCVKVKDDNGTISKKFFTVTVKNELVNNSVLSAENITLGQEITVNCLADGGKAPYQYQVVYKQTSQTKWTAVQNFSANSSVTFKPAKPAVYDVCVKVKDDNGTIIKKFFTVTVIEALANTSAISSENIVLGQEITVNCSATGGAGGYTYAVYYKQKAQTKWTAKQDFKENAVVSVKPAQATDYDICIKVKDKDGTISKQYFTVTVTE